MPVSIDIVPFSDSLELHGESDFSSAFSLAGHVSVSLSSPLLMFQRRRSTTRALLQSLTVTFEGQSEVITPDIGYAPLRLCSITRELVNGEPVDLSNEGHEDSDKPCSWNVTFDIPVPGWLPTTSTYGDHGAVEAGTRYALYATATFIYPEDGSSSIFSSFCSPFGCRTHTINAPMCPVTLARFAEVPSAPSSSSSTSVFPMSLFIVDAQSGQDGTETNAKTIPPEILKKIQVVASIPNAITMDETSVPLILRLQGSELDCSQRERLRITDFTVDVEQIETYRSTTSLDYVARYMVPPRAQQPPCCPLRNAHSVHTLYDVGLLMIPYPSKSSSTRSFSLFDPSNSGTYIISGDGRIFSHDSPEGDATTRSPSENWYVLETDVPLAQKPYQLDWAGPRIRRISENSPLFTVCHMMHVGLRCVYEQPDGEVVCERLHFSLPMQLVRVAAPLTSPATDCTVDGPVELQKSASYSQNLPAYSQLFYSNGERKIDYSTPLPLYEPPQSASSSSFTLDQSDDHRKSIS
ncbi:hypothetical protein DEU56DRAFT_22471 [Suillus clintonianus]|uniref:uncharacterized protein n=1 Tax=Suillus clintonianus TaxID=1904413 RepID=UPI001B863513|nr:uncharacterized protein DEU56DRAFT_22471 [Suillus clintonianus]KAG2157487.1 hypothetical protein DEU56DRAFT_22471 [Suillus clintonianus]